LIEDQPREVQLGKADRRVPGDLEDQPRAILTVFLFAVSSREKGTLQMCLIGNCPVESVFNTPTIAFNKSDS
jgi:hypothetical protein